MSLDQAAADVILTIGQFRIPDTDVDRDDAISAWLTLVAAKRNLTHLIEDFENYIGSTMHDRYETAAGVTVQRNQKASRTQWDTDALKSAVLDSRLVDEVTGEIKDESPLDRVLMVWNLGTPRLTALRARGIDPEEFCRVEHFDRWTLREHS